MYFLSETLKNKAKEDFYTMFAMKPEELHKVQLKDVDVEVKRYSKSFMNTPPISKFVNDNDNNNKYKYRTSYMFSGIDDSKTREPLPEIFKPYLDYVNNLFQDCNFNQVSINWYNDGKDYIAFHRDCEEYMAGNKNIAILTFNEDLEEPRSITFKNEEHSYDVQLEHGSILVITPEIQKKYKHGIKKMEGGKKRISLSFRQFID